MPRAVLDAAQASSGPFDAAQHSRIATAHGQPVQLGDEGVAGDRAGDQATEALAGELIDNRHDFTGHLSVVESN